MTIILRRYWLTLIETSKVFMAITLLLTLLVGCRPNPAADCTYLKISGNTMGTTYAITYDGKENLKSEIDKILLEINNSVSTYIPTSTISVINNDSLGEDIDTLALRYAFKRDLHFESNFQSAKEVFNMTDGYFDASIMPLVNYWGFGYTKKRGVTVVDSLYIKALVQISGMEKWQYSADDNSFVIIKPRGAQLDFGGIAKGYGVDKIGDFLTENGISNYMVEIGGEVRCEGQNAKGTGWVIGLSRPEISANFNDFQALVQLTNMGMASSGNYRNYYEINGITYGHEINPKTGYPEISKLLGSTVIAKSCKMADAYATAFMVLGLEKSLKLAEEIKDLEACFFYRKESGEIDLKTTQGFDTFILPSQTN